MRTGRMVTAALALVVVGVATFTWAAGGNAGGVDPSAFTDPKANAYFPIVPGTTFVYRGSEDGEHLHERLRITHDTELVAGVRTVVVLDVLRSHGALVERTIDWYQGDDQGNVWYFGERTATYDAQGHVESREGSWRAGVDGAVAGIIMPADPGPTDAYRQEMYRGEAEDQAWIVQRGIHTRVPFGTVRHAIRSFEWTRLEPNVLSMKLYAPHLGIVRERDVAGGDELLELTKVIRP